MFPAADWYIMDRPQKLSAKHSCNVCVKAKEKKKKKVP